MRLPITRTPDIRLKPMQTPFLVLFPHLMICSHTCEQSIGDDTIILAISRWCVSAQCAGPGGCRLLGTPAHPSFLPHGEVIPEFVNHPISAEASRVVVFIATMLITMRTDSV